MCVAAVVGVLRRAERAPRVRGVRSRCRTPRPCLQRSGSRLVVTRLLSSSGRCGCFAVGRPATHQRACQLERVLPFISRSAQTRTSNEVCRSSLSDERLPAVSGLMGRRVAGEAVEPGVQVVAGDAGLAVGQFDGLGAGSLSLPGVPGGSWQRAVEAAEFGEDLVEGEQDPLVGAGELLSCGSGSRRGAFDAAGSARSRREVAWVSWGSGWRFAARGGVCSGRGDAHGSAASAAVTPSLSSDLTPPPTPRAIAASNQHRGCYR